MVSNGSVQTQEVSIIFLPIAVTAYSGMSYLEEVYFKIYIHAPAGVQEEVGHRLHRINSDPAAAAAAAGALGPAKMDSGSIASISMFSGLGGGGSGGGGSPPIVVMGLMLVGVFALAYMAAQVDSAA